VNAEQRQRRELRKEQTDAERLLWRYLRGRQFGGHKSDGSIRSDPSSSASTATKWRLWWRWMVLNIWTENRSSDSRRTGFLEEHGIRVVRFTNREVLQERNGVLTKLLHALDSRTI
jgi:very-short-patch-repair endonuclease